MALTRLNKKGIDRSSTSTDMSKAYNFVCSIKKKKTRTNQERHGRLNAWIEKSKTYNAVYNTNKTTNNEQNKKDTDLQIREKQNSQCYL